MTRKQDRKVRPVCESLEGRQVLSLSVPSLAGGVPMIRGSSHNDTARDINVIRYDNLGANHHMNSDITLDPGGHIDATTQTRTATGLGAACGGPTQPPLTPQAPSGLTAMTISTSQHLPLFPPPPPPLTLQAPSGLTATTISTSQINLSWRDVAGATGYQVERSIDGFTWIQAGTTGDGVTAFQDTGRTANTTYWYRVQATDGWESSPYSHVVRAKTLDLSLPAAGTYFLRDKATGFNLDSNANQQVYTLTLNGGAYQKWELTPSGDGYFYLRDDATGFYLDSNANQQVYTLAFNGGDYQKWELISSGNGYYYLRDKATGFYLDSNANQQVYTLAFNGGEYQQWRFDATTTPLPAAGTYFLRDKATGFNLDSNANQQVYTLTLNGGAYQKWELTPSGDGYYYLRDKATGFYLDSNANQQVYTLAFNGGDYQKWWLTSIGNGYYYLRDKATGFYLDSNANQQVYTLAFNGGEYQQWRFDVTTGV